MEPQPLSKLLNRFLLLLFVSILLFLADNLRILNLPKNFITTATIPAQIAVYKTYQDINNTFGFLTFWKSGYSQIAYLKQRNLELLVTAQNAAKLKEQNAILESQFKQTPNLSPSLLSAQVIGLDRFLELNKGEKEGVKTGDTVLLNSVLVGKINKVMMHQSQVILLTDPSSKTPVISSYNKSKGILEGTFGTGLLLTNVLQGDTLETEETVETWGATGFPSGLLAGKILGVENKESALFKTATVAPLIDYNKLTTVFILLN